MLVSLHRTECASGHVTRAFGLSETLDIDECRDRHHADRVNLAEILTALAMLGLVLSGTVAVFAQGQRAYTRGVARVESQQSARFALARMAREIRQAGGGGVPPIAVAETERIVLQRAEGTITWQLSAGVLRRNAGAGAQPIIHGVRALVLGYRDAAGHSTSIPADVRAVVVTLTTQPEHPGPGGATAIKLTTEVRLRNR